MVITQLLLLTLFQMTDEFVIQLCVCIVDWQTAAAAAGGGHYAY